MRQKTIKSILAHAEKAYPAECCGVIAKRGRVERYFPCSNQSVEPTDYAMAEDWGDVVAIVHSHTGEGATTQPSELDMLQCDATELPWVIASWPEGDIRTVYPELVNYSV